MQQRFLSHAKRCVQQFSSVNTPRATEDQDIENAFHDVGDLYADQGKLVEAGRCPSWNPSWN